MRYALYFAAPANDPLMQSGNAWLGRDPFSGQAVDQPAILGLTEERIKELTSDPRRYGFHGTLKAPFALAEGVTEEALVNACAAFAAQIAPFGIGGLGVNRLGKFLALIPIEDAPDLSAFASLCVRHFDGFRAPLSAEDLKRRRNANLTPKQDSYVQDWGYPYIFDEFRFHMTLSNKLEDEQEATLLADAAKTHMSAISDKAMRCRHFGLYSETERGAPFMVQKIFELTGSESPAAALEKSLSATREETE